MPDAVVPRPGVPARQDNVPPLLPPEAQALFGYWLSPWYVCQELWCLLRGVRTWTHKI
jgi:hypothetical protein